MTDSHMAGDVPKSAARDVLIQTAKDTIAVLPSILKARPELDATRSELLSFNDVAPLRSADAPGYPKINVRVVNQDSIQAAIDAAATPALTPSNQAALRAMASRPLVMNFASDKRPGGGWLTGAKAQEECLCYCSSLSLSLDKSHYPIPLHKFSYTKDVVVIRDADLRLITINSKPEDLPVVSCVNIAALRRPQLSNDKYVRPQDRDWMRKKMRATLRIAGRSGHTRLVLGAFGCGAFKNPVDEVAGLWKEVLNETEFGAGWWQDIVFAVLWHDNSETGKDNFEIFKDALHDMVIGT